MFADLVKLRDQRFVKKHDLIRLYLPEKTIDLHDCVCICRKGPKDTDRL